MLFYNIVGKKRGWKRVWEKERERETARNTIRYQSGHCTANRALITGREGCGSEGSLNCLKRGPWSIGIPTLNEEWGGFSFEVAGCPAVKKKLNRAPSLCPSVSFFLVPLWLFHLSLTNSSSGSQPLADSLSWQQKTMATTTGRARPVPKVRPRWLLRLAVLFEPPANLADCNQWQHELILIEVGDQETVACVTRKEFISSPLAEKEVRSCAGLRSEGKRNQKSEKRRTRERGSSLSGGYTVPSSSPLLTILTPLLLMIQLCLHPSLLPPTLYKLFLTLHKIPYVNWNVFWMLTKQNSGCLQTHKRPKREKWYEE